MDVASKNLTEMLGEAAEQLRHSGLPGELAATMERLAEQVEQPCVVAVVGRVKAGKSTFINALLGDDLAMVGATETTATINYFRYGQPDQRRPVRCYWQSGTITDEDRSFLDSLQGSDEVTLRRAFGVDHLEYRLPLPYLEQITLVDTPGTGAVVDEHQERIAAYMQLHSLLRERHEQETRRLERDADAIIYVIGGAIARATDQDFLKEFHEASGGHSRSLNAIGVMTKLELHPAALEQRGELAAKIAAQLAGSLNTVVPVGSGIARALASLLADGGADLLTMIDTLRRIPPTTLTKLLAMDTFYLRPDIANCPVSIEERQQLLGAMPWAVFTTIARIAADPDLSSADVAQRLEDMAGMEPLNEILDRRFIKRSRFLRAYRIAGDARRVLRDIQYNHLPALRRRQHEDAARRDRYLTFLDHAAGDQGVAQELAAFIEQHLAEHTDIQPILAQLDRRFSGVYAELQAYNSDLDALQQIEDNPARFTTEEFDELRPLFGLYGLDLESRLPGGRRSDTHVGGRQQWWRQISMLERDPVRRAVAQRAEARYGLALRELQVPMMQSSA